MKNLRLLFSAFLVVTALAVESRMSAMSHEEAEAQWRAVGIQAGFKPLGQYHFPDEAEQKKVEQKKLMLPGSAVQLCASTSEPTPNQQPSKTCVIQ